MVGNLSLRAERSNPTRRRKCGLLRRFTLVRKRFAFVAGNDGKDSCAPSSSLRAERSNPWLGIAGSKMDCFVPSLLAMTAKYWLAISSTPSRSRRMRASYDIKCFALELKKGAGNAGRSMRPQPRMQNKKAYEHSHHGHTGITRHSPHNGFNGFLRALPSDRALLPLSSAGHYLPT